jgi:hypothetical protein
MREVIVQNVMRDPALKAVTAPVTLDDSLAKAGIAAAPVRPSAPPPRPMPCFVGQRVDGEQEAVSETVVIPGPATETRTCEISGVAFQGVPRDATGVAVATDLNPHNREDIADAFVVKESDPWPAEAKLYIEGYCLNPKLLSARLYEEEGGQKFRRVSVWKDRSGRLKAGMKVPCRLDKGGATPVYMVV